MNKELVKIVYQNYYINKSSNNLKLLFEAYNFFSNTKREQTNCGTCLLKIKKEFEIYLNKK
jgi:hypothetical protein